MADLPAGRQAHSEFWAGGEMADALALGASAARHAGSSPALPTKTKTRRLAGF